MSPNLGWMSYRQRPLAQSTSGLQRGRFAETANGRVRGAEAKLSPSCRGKLRPSPVDLALVEIGMSKLHRSEGVRLAGDTKIRGHVLGAFRLDTRRVAFQHRSRDTEAPLDKEAHNRRENRAHELQHVHLEYTRPMLGTQTNCRIGLVSVSRYKWLISPKLVPCRAK
ncbi:hypothetical protein NUW58_g994 [Xylaria curta]|uniref:Uncharacterized protein n=1 Tax=Xylaria curta TaxID=42375 RepID=A0ACC1PMN9_9PEZI|nr:hypothetical protein NUW58_g994 [Xylaria curta]